MNEFEKNIKNLTMTPDMWYGLSLKVSHDEYHEIVMDYQKREFDRLPECKTIFGLCRYYSFGKCTKKGKCVSKCK